MKKKNMLLLSTLLIVCLVIISCTRNNDDRVAYRITEQDLIPEGITYSSSTNSFYISSIYKTKIVQIDAESGEFKDFINSDLLDIRFLGMITDETRNHLWACGNMTRNDKRYSTVAKFSLQSRELLKSYQHVDTIRSTYNDLVLDKEGNVYFTDYPQNKIMFIDQQTDSVKTFHEGVEIEHPNGITISTDDKYLYVASGTKGIRVLDILTNQIVNEPDTSINSTVIDGLKYYQNSLIAIQNGYEDQSNTKICKYYLDESKTKITKMEIIDQNNPLFDIPTTFVIVANDLYCLATSQLGNLGLPEYNIVDPEKLKDILILRYSLK